MSKIRSGFRVVGNDAANNKLTVWYFPSRELADAFAVQLCKDTGQEVDVMKHLGSWRRAEPPVELVQATDVETKQEP